jgi:hypothetical protein
MPSIVEIAERAGVSIDGLVRALNDEATEAERSQIATALAELGDPAPTVLESLSVLTGARTGAGARPSPPVEARLDGPGSSGRHLSAMDALIRELAQQLDALGEGLADEQRERLDDAKVLLQLIVAGWRSVERRVERVERTLDGSTASP